MLFTQHLLLLLLLVLLLLLLSTGCWVKNASQIRILWHHSEKGERCNNV